MQPLFYIFLLQNILVHCERIFSNATPMIGEGIKQAQDNDYPFVAAIGHREFDDSEGDENSFCTGALITDQLILTSSHCLEGETKDTLQVHIGSADLRAGEKYLVAGMITYDEWAEELDVVLEFDDNDMALILLAETVDHVTPATISMVQKRKLVGTDAYVAGWGVWVNGDIPRYLQKGKVRVTSLAECTTNIRKFPESATIIVPNRYMCTDASPHVRIQSGDSGGPVFNDKFEIIGINDATCPKTRPSSEPNVMNVHVGIEYYRPFILDVIDNIDMIKTDEFNR